MKKDLVSIIIPTFNRANYLKRSIKSCISQSYRNIEIIIIDDCSSDNTKNVVKNIDDSRIKYFRNSKNRGAPYSRNKGIKLSKGKYINFLDDDDILYAKKIELQVNKFKQSDIKNLGVVTCHVKYSRPDISSIKRNNKKGNIYKELLSLYCIFGTETMLIKNDVLKQIKGYDVNLPANQEYDLAIRLAKKVNFEYIDKVLSKKSLSKDQISFNFQDKINATSYFFHKYNIEFWRQGIIFYLYNIIRFSYLFTRYYIGKFWGMKIYRWLK